MVFLFLILFIVACGGDDNPAGPDADKTPPTITSTSPADDAVNVPADVVISVSFSEPIASTTIESSTFIVDNGVSGNFSFSGTTATLTPSGWLAYAATYTVTITTGVTDTAGNNLANNYTWSFSTEADPATIPPVVVSTNPAQGAVDTPVDAPITATFSKEMDAATLTQQSFIIDNGVSGTVTYSNKIATYTPVTSLEYGTTYTATITSAVADTFGNNLTTNYIWTFSTPSLIPQVVIFSPSDSAIIGENLTISAIASHPIGVDSAEFFIDGQYLVTVFNPAGTFDYAWDATGSSIGSTHAIYVKAFASDSIGISDTILVFYLWEELMSDMNDPWITDLSKVLARSNDTLLEFRYEFWESWYDPYDTIPDDTTLDLGIYFDTDRNPSTGRTDFATTPLNDIGAEYRVIIGLHGWDTALAIWNVTIDTSFWDKVYDPSGFVYLNLPPNDKVLEFGIRWADLNNTSAVNIVSINLFFQSTTSFIPDWVPDQGNGHLTMRRENRYIGKGFSGSPSTGFSRCQTHPVMRDNPFNSNKISY